MKIMLNADGLSKVTQRVVKDFNTLTEMEFFKKYSCSKAKYLMRFKIWGDPYMNAPLAKLAKIIKKYF